MREAVRRLKSRAQIPNTKYKQILFQWDALDVMGKWSWDLNNGALACGKTSQNQWLEYRRTAISDNTTRRLVLEGTWKWSPLTRHSPLNFKLNATYSANCVKLYSCILVVNSFLFTVLGFCLNYFKELAIFFCLIKSLGSSWLQSFSPSQNLCTQIKSWIWKYVDFTVGQLQLPLLK